jgi:hypothetical protein
MDHHGVHTVAIVHSPVSRVYERAGMAPVLDYAMYEKDVGDAA